MNYLLSFFKGLRERSKTHKKEYILSTCQPSTNQNISNMEFNSTASVCKIIDRSKIRMRDLLYYDSKNK